MSKKSKQQRKAETVADKISVPSNKSSLFDSPGLIRLILLVVVLIIYGSSVNFDFTLDDDMFYIKHSSVQQGLSAAPEMFANGSLNKFDGTTGVQPYRPVTLLVFALQKVLFDNSAPLAHFFNVLLYILLIQLLFSLLMKLFKGVHIMIPALITLIYAVHPIHTEVVCSVKSMDELLAAGFGFGAWYFFISKKEGENISRIQLLAGSVLFMLGLMSKESAIAFLAIIPLSNWMLGKSGIKPALISFMPLLIMAVLFLVIRFNVVGTGPASSGIPLLENVLNGAESWSEKWATKFVILLKYLSLLFIPWPLNWDYSFNQIPIVQWSSPLAIMGLLIYTGLAVLALILFKKRPELSFSILFFFITSAPTNNLFFNNGATVGERFLFTPSLAFAMAMVWLFVYLFKADRLKLEGAGKNKLTGIILILSVVFALLSMKRSPDWKTNLSLFERGVEVSPNSSRTQYSLATEYMRQAQAADDRREKADYYNRAIERFKKSVEIFPKNSQAHYNTGICYTQMGDTAMAVFHYRKCIEAKDNYEEAMNNLGVLYQGRRMFDSAQYYYELGLRVDPAAKKPIKNLTDLFGMKGAYLGSQGNYDAALESYKRSLVYDPGNLQTLNNMASIFSNRKNYDSAMIYLKRANQKDPGALMVIENIAAVSFLSGNYTQAIEYANRGLAINPGSRKSLGVLADTYQAMGNVAEGSRYRNLFNRAR